MCEHCRDLGQNIDAMPHDFALKQPQPKLADAVRLFGACPHCCEVSAPTPAQPRPLMPTEQLALFA